jgi:hypothetical protein
MTLRTPMLAAFILAYAITSNAARAQISPPLRGGIECDKATIALALDLNRQGWVYVMPQPKSPQAAWGNRDGRTT